jgi:lipopolysaccharide export system permease protein
MTRILHRHLVKRLLFVCFIVILICTGPVMLVSLFSHLSTAAFYPEFLIPALRGIVPLILYLALPLAVGIAATWYYGHLTAESEVAAMYSAGFSVLSVSAPAIVVALLATFFGYFLSCYLAPQSAAYLEDVAHLVAQQPRPSLLQPNRLYTLEGGRRVFFFEERLNKEWIARIFMREITAENVEKTYYARRATFMQREQESLVVLFDGFVQTQKPGDPVVETMNFERVVHPMGLAGSELPKRDWIAEFELSTSDFLRARATMLENPKTANVWKSEALKRFGVPLLALSHTLLGLGLIMTWGTATGRRRLPVIAVCTILVAIHTLVMISTESLIRQHGWLVWPIAGLILAELLFGMILLVRLQRRHAEPIRVYPG